MTSEKPSPAGRQRKITDDDLRRAIDEGLSVAQIAERYSVSRQAVNKRCNQLKLTTTAAVVAPVESQRFVSTQIDLMLQLAKGLERVNLMMDACDRWLRDANDPSLYDIGARSEEIQVTYWEIDSEGKTRKAKDTLESLLRQVEKRFETVRSETRHADPRELILKTVQEARQTAQAVTDMAERLAAAKTMELFRQTLLLEIAKVDPGVAQRIAEAVRRSLVLAAATSGFSALPA